MTSFRTKTSLERSHAGQLASPEHSKSTFEQQAALRGASQAFVRRPAKSKPLVTTYSSTDGARTAAAKAETARAAGKAAAASGSASNVTFYRSGNAANAPLAAAQQSIVRRSQSRDPSSSLHLSGSAEPQVSSSPSNIAASLAAARLTPQSSGGGRPRKTSSGPARQRASPGRYDPLERVVPAPKDGDKATLGSPPRGHPSAVTNEGGPDGSTSRSRERPDSTSILPTASLVGIFEKVAPISESKKVHRGYSIRTTNVPPVIQSPRPIRPLSSGGTSLTEALTPAHNISDSRDRSKEPTSAVPSTHSAGVSSTPFSPSEQGQIPLRIYSTNQIPPKSTPEAVRSSGGSTSSPDDGVQPASKSLGSVKVRNARRASNVQLSLVDQFDGSSSEVPSDARTKPAIPPPRRSENMSSARVKRPSSVGQRGSTVDQSAPEAPLKRDPRHLVTRSTSSYMNDISSSSAGDKWARPSLKPLSSLNESSLADAIVASSLASSRAPSPTKSPAPPLPQRQLKPHHLFYSHHHDVQISRTPSPAKGMRHTMRKPTQSDDEAEASSRRGIKIFAKKHPNKHHEGDRKRWRDALTERERKRYEGVWAANKDPSILEEHIKTTRDGRPVEGVVPNLVVRDVWSRSRLGNEVLEEIWDLVDRQGSGTLTREEYVVGMWLIDQRLKGRKLPISVSHSVWDSARQLSGVKIRRKKR